jgi:hypothetical protein
MEEILWRQDQGYAQLAPPPLYQLIFELLDLLRALHTRLTVASAVLSEGRHTYKQRVESRIFCYP